MNDVIREAQRDLINLVDQFDIKTFPKAVLLYGTCGSGKHAIVEHAAAKFGIPVHLIEDKLDPDTLAEFYLSSNPHMYCIDIDQLIRERRVEGLQASLLKFVEEPPQSAIIFVLCECATQVPETIKNRCVLWRMHAYTLEQLQTLQPTLTRDIFSLLNTPGKLENFTVEEASKTMEFAEFFLKNIVKASVSNILTAIPPKFESGEYNLDLFLSAICRALELEVEPESFELYKLTKDFQKDLKVFNVTRKYLLDRYLLSCKNIV